MTSLEASDCGMAFQVGSVLATGVGHSTAMILLVVVGVDVLGVAGVHQPHSRC